MKKLTPGQMRMLIRAGESFRPESQYDRQVLDAGLKKLKTGLEMIETARKEKQHAANR